MQRLIPLDGNGEFALCQRIGKSVLSFKPVPSGHSRAIDHLRSVAEQLRGNVLYSHWISNREQRLEVEIYDMDAHAFMRRLARAFTSGELWFQTKNVGANVLIVRWIGEQQYSRPFPVALVPPAGAGIEAAHAALDESEVSRG